MNGFLKRGLITLAVTGGFLALGAGVAYADDGTDGDDGLLSGTQAVLGIDLPVTISGSGISIIGDSSSSGSSSSGGGSTSAPSGSTSGSNSLLGGTQGLIGANIPVTVSGDAISVIGDSSSEGSSFPGASGAGDTGTASTSGKEGILGGSQVVGDVNTPVTVSGNAISVLGDSSSNSATAAGASGSGSSAPSGTTSGTDSVLGGTQVLADAGAPVTVGGNAISVVGDSSSTGSSTSTPATGGSGTATTTGDDGILGGTQIVTGANAPITVGGNAISVIGDSTVDNPTTGGPTDPTDPTDPGEVGGETTTPPAGDVAAVSAGALLAQTGSALTGWVLALALLLLAAGVTFVARTRTARA